MTGGQHERDASLWRFQRYSFGGLCFLAAAVLLVAAEGDRRALALSAAVGVGGLLLILQTRRSGLRRSGD